MNTTAPQIYAVHLAGLRQRKEGPEAGSLSPERLPLSRHHPHRILRGESGMDGGAQVPRQDPRRGGIPAMDS